MTIKTDLGPHSDRLSMGLSVDPHLYSKVTLPRGSGKTGMVLKQLASRASRGHGAFNEFLGGYRNLGQGMESSAQILSRLGIKEPEYTPFDDHIVEPGGDAGMVDKISHAFSNLEGVVGVYYLKDGEKHSFVVVFEEDHPKLGRFLAEVQVRAYEEYGVYCDSTYEIAEDFEEDELPENYSKIYHRG
ncbi:hypothetical protein MKY92_21660 [Paenibacillus sp. FSL R5-0623]|uniref:hypothetical protein n=1 Tax=Paenibacillus sp. FSL R5-0623 TaxID=2921651 RepID=UPI0030D6F099